MSDILPAPICVDASFVAAIVLPEAVSPTADAIWQTWVENDRIIMAPAHMVAETLTAVRRSGLRGDITAEEEERATDTLVARLLPRVNVSLAGPHLWRRALAWARELGRANVYDTLYLSLAEESGAEFWTIDANLIRALTTDGRPLPEWVHLASP